MDFDTLVPGKAGLAGIDADALLVVVVGAKAPAALQGPLALPLAEAVTAGDFAFKAGQLLYAHRVAGVKARRVAYAWAADSGPKALRKAVAAGVALLKGGGTQHLAVAVAGASTPPDAATAQALLLAVHEATYVYRATKPSAPAAPKLVRVTLVGASNAEEAALAAGLARGDAVAAGVALARELANRPANHCTPSYLAEQARKLGKSHGLKVEVLERKDCDKLGMGAFLAVAQGSEQPPKFIVVRWQGAAKGEPPLVLVGKGITFDTGGISIKPGPGMEEMKFDMCGAGTVLGVFQAVIKLGLPINLICIVPAVENMPDGQSYRPSDVLTSMSGKTIEVLNTDAEGRLILCDALTYAQTFHPETLIDVATLTGACVVALGKHAHGLMSKHDDLAAELAAAGEKVHDRAWRLPIWDDYQSQLDSGFADVANIGGKWAGAITAGCFLARFTEGQRWAHLDIAGTAWDEGRKGLATGRPVPLLVQWLMDRCG